MFCRCGFVVKVFFRYVVFRCLDFTPLLSLPLLLCALNLPHDKVVNADTSIMLIQGLTDRFKAKDTRFTGSATLDYESFMTMILPFIVA